MGIPFHEVRLWSAAEVLLYQCYYRVAPWGEDRADIRNAMGMCQTANMHRDPVRHPQAFEYLDFMPFYEKPETDHESEPVGLRDMFTAMARKK